MPPAVNQPNTQPESGKSTLRVKGVVYAPKPHKHFRNALSDKLKYFPQSDRQQFAQTVTK